jgi:glutamate N-acetyltransferase/amino-acid N-acetyltransferase
LDYDEAVAAEIMAKQEIRISIEIGEATVPATVWTCDLSYDYVKINAEYRT